jgi:hypothetical protein
MIELTFIEVMAIISFGITGASSFLKVAEIVARYTKTKTDDAVISTVMQWLLYIEKVLNFIAINPKKGKAKR